MKFAQTSTESKQIKLAVYGTLRKGHGNNILLKNSKFLGLYITPPIYTMYIVGISHKHGYPIVVPGGSTPITTEVYEINEATLANTDMLEGYPNYYNRKIIDTDYGPAWIYYMDNSYGLTLDSGDFNS